MNIRRATSNDLNAIKNIWRISFGDTEEFIDFHFSLASDLSYTFLGEIDSQIATMVTVLPAELHHNKKYRVGYIYAAATSPQFRGQGLMARMLSYCESYAIKEDYAALSLVPSSLSLFDFYQSHGYERSFYHNNIIKDYNIDNNSSKINISQCSLKEYAKARKQLTNRYALLMLDDFYNELSLKELEFSGYSAYKIDDNRYAIIKKDIDSINIHELVCGYGQEKDTLNQLAKSLGVNKAKYRAPIDIEMGDESDCKPFAMMKWLEARPIGELVWYTNNLLD